MASTSVAVRELVHQLLGLPLAVVGEAGAGNVGVETPSALAWDCALRTNVTVMLRACGVPPQAPTITVAASTARTLGAFQTMVRLRISIACPADRVVVKGLDG